MTSLSAQAPARELPRMDMLTTRQAAAELGISPSRVRQLVMEGRLPARLHGRELVILRADLEAVRVRPNGRPRTSSKPRRRRRGRTS